MIAFAAGLALGCVIGAVLTVAYLAAEAMYGKHW
jgi:hypothetical protein